MNWRSPKLLERLRQASIDGELPCTWPMPHRCSGGIVYAHSNQGRDGKGGALKAHDYRIAFMCHAAHMECDQGKTYDQSTKVYAWDEAHRKSVGILFEQEYVRVK